MNGLTMRLILIFTLCAHVAVSQETTLNKNDVPAAVLESFQKAYPGATVKGYSKEVEKGVLTYEIESMEGNTHRDVSYAADGTLISTEETIAFTKLPPAVQEKISSEYPKGKISVCEKITKSSTIQFEVLVKSGKKSYEILLNADGTIAERETK